MTSRVLVKLCGLRTAADVDHAVACGADAVGIVLAPSPRRVALSRARALLARVPDGVLRVVVLGRPTAALAAAARSLPCDAVQCEVGDAPPPSLGPGRFLLPSFRDGADVLERVALWRERVPRAEHAHPLAGAVLLDGPLGGGRGRRADHERARLLARSVPLVLAGGLTPDDVAAAVRTVQPLAVDVSSGIEEERGVKDAARMTRFVAEARRGERALEVRA